jgi:hypothetical protein
MAEQLTLNQLVLGSSPSRGTNLPNGFHKPVILKSSACQHLAAGFAAMIPAQAAIVRATKENEGLNH